MTKLLLIDDEETNLRVLSMTLVADGYEVLTAGNGQQGLSLFAAEGPDIVITDIKMPGMDGIQVLANIKAADPEAEVIIITGHGDIDNAIEALKLGASDFISKPIRDEVLAIALNRAREKRNIKQQLRAYTDNLKREVKIATRELRRKSNFLSKLVKSANDGIVATDQNLDIVIFNPGAERIFGFSRYEITHKKNAVDLFPPEIIDFLKKEKPRSHLTGEIPWEETQIHAKDGQGIPVRFYGTLLYEKHDVMGSVTFFQDLREIKRLESELIRSERLAAIGQTVAGMAHGVKNILHGFKGGSYLLDLAIKKNDTEKLKQGWGLIQRNIDRTSDLVLNLLSYSKERDPEFSSCLPNEIAAEVCDLLHETAKEHHVTLDRDFDPSIGMVALDSHTLHGALMNLISNAIDACIFDEIPDKDWRVSVKTRLAPPDRIAFQVTDNGVGMTEDVQKRIFTSFFSTKGHKGTGLGLLVTRKNIEEHGGRIEVSSFPGKGTRFTVHLPFKPITDEFQQKQTLTDNQPARRSCDG